MCYCKTGAGDLEASVESAKTKIPELKAELEASSGTLEETKEGLKQDTAERDATKAAIAEATGLREKENKQFVASKDEYTANIAAVKKAVASLEKGVAGSFLQTAEANLVKRYAMERAEVPDSIRQELLAFLSARSPRTMPRRAARSPAS